MITLTDYWMGRDARYAAQCTDVIHLNASGTVRAVNKLLAQAQLDDIIRDTVASGWRPACVNDATCNSAVHSNHLTALAVDIADPNRVLAQWCLLNLDKLGDLNLFMEDPRWTPTWVHLQVVPPKSGKRVYVPNNSAPIAPALVVQKPLPARVVV